MTAGVASATPFLLPKDHMKKEEVVDLVELTVIEENMISTGTREGDREVFHKRGDKISVPAETAAILDKRRLAVKLA